MLFAEKFQIQQFPVNTISHVLFRSKKVIEKLSTFVGILFAIEHCFLSKNKAILRNPNHYSECREQRKNPQKILDIFAKLQTFQKSFYSLQVKRYLISFIKNIVYKLPREFTEQLQT